MSALTINISRRALETVAKVAWQSGLAISLRIQVCPKKGITPHSYSKDGGGGALNPLRSGRFVRILRVLGWSIQNSGTPTRWEKTTYK